MLSSRDLGKRLVAVRTRAWRPRSRLFLVGEGTSWSIDHDLEELAATAARIGIRVADRRLLGASRDQAAFFGSQFALLQEPWAPPPHALATAYFHGRPGTPGMPEFDECYRVLARRHRELARIQVTHAEMRELVLGAGTDPAKVVTIPIGINLDTFSTADASTRAAVRADLDLPQYAFVVGSFQKDGVGFGEGLEPKLVKGPDVLVEALRILREAVPELHVLLSGPARGYVTRRLDELSIPYRHVIEDAYARIGRLYHALDAYVVPSRQEGGPKGVLEAMASGVPVVTTRVGQAAEIVRHGENGYLVDVEDAEALGAWLGHVAARSSELPPLIAAGRTTAEEHAYDRQTELWRGFFDGLVAP